MTANKFSGQIEIKIGAVNGVLEYDWDAIAKARSKFSMEQLRTVFEMNPDDIAELAAIGFAQHSPSLTVEAIKKAKPPIAAVAKAIDNALTLAYHGPEEGRQIIEKVDELTEAMDPLKRADKAKNAKKKTR